MRRTAPQYDLRITCSSKSVSWARNRLAEYLIKADGMNFKINFVTPDVDERLVITLIEFDPMFEMMPGMGDQDESGAARNKNSTLQTRALA